MRILSILLLLLCACGTEKHVYDTGQFETFVERFRTQMRIAGENQKEIHDLTIVFEPNIDPKVRALCGVTDTLLPKIQVNKKSWDGLDDSYREQIIFHELGHCILGRGHRVEPLHLKPCPIGSAAFCVVPDSIMNPVAIEEHIVASEYKTYMKELFSDNRDAGTVDNMSYSLLTFPSLDGNAQIGIIND